MTLHITIPIEAEELERARQQATTLGVPVEDYLHQLVKGHLPLKVCAKKADISMIVGIGESKEPTEIAKDKHKLLGESAWQEFTEETGRP